MRTHAHSGQAAPFPALQETERDKESEKKTTRAHLHGRVELAERDLAARHAVHLAFERLDLRRVAHVTVRVLAREGVRW